MNTLILLTSGTTVTWAHHALLENDRQGLKWGLAAHHPARADLHLRAGLRIFARRLRVFSGNIYGATFFMATGFHGAHVIIGSIFLIVCLLRALNGHFSPTQHLGFEFAAWYWHFVDVVWLFLFACIYVWGSGASAAHGRLIARCDFHERAAATPPFCFLIEDILKHAPTQSASTGVSLADRARTARPLSALRRGHVVPGLSQSAAGLRRTAASTTASPMPATGRRCS